MTPKHGGKSRRSISIFIVLGLCCFCYLLGAWHRSGFGNGDNLAMKVSKVAESTDCSVKTDLDFEPHHKFVGSIVSPEVIVKQYKPCDIKYKDYTPCEEQDRAMKFPRDDMIYRERHCPPPEEKLHCLIPAPVGYTTPFPWPKSWDYVHYANVPYKHLTVEKAVQHWVEFQGDVFKFPGGGTMFPQGADAYIDELASVIPIADGSIRTTLDTGCEVCFPPNHTHSFYTGYVVIFRDAVDPLIKVKQIARGMRWDLKLVDHEDGPFVPEKILYAVKQYWVMGEKNSTSSYQ